MSDYISSGGVYTPPSYDFGAISSNMSSNGAMRGSDFMSTSKGVGLGSSFNFGNFISSNSSGMFGVLSAGINALSSVASNRAQRKEAEKNREFNRIEAEKNRQWQAKMVREEREYNTPENQRALMEAAGFNPNVLASGMAGSSISSSTSASGAQASSSSMPSNTPVGYGAMADIANIRLTNSQADVNEAQVGKLTSETQGQDINNTIQQLESYLLQNYGEVEKKLGINAQELSNNLTKVQTALTEMQEKISKFNLDELLPKEALKLISEIAANEASRELDESHAAYQDRKNSYLDLEMGMAVGLYWKQLESMDFQNMESRARTLNLGASTALLGEEASYTRSKTYGQRLSNKFSAYDYNLRARNASKYEKAFVGELNRTISETDIFGDNQRGFVSFFRGLNFILDSTVGNVPVTFLK